VPISRWELTRATTVAIRSGFKARGRIAGAYIAPAVAYQMYPDRLRGADRMMNSGALYLATRGATNLLREFWPEIHRVIRIGPKPRY